MRTIRHLGIRIGILLVMVSFCPVTLLIAQTHGVNFEKISSSNGISLGKINAMTQDAQGFMWFSDQTNHSIYRYDGSHLTNYTYDSTIPNSLGGGYPECFATDPSGNLWIGFFGQGLDRFDPSTGHFTHYRHDQDDPESLSDDNVWAILVDHLGMVWVGTNKGLDQLDPTTGKFTHYNHDQKDPSSMSHDVVRAIYEDRQGTLWVGTGMPWTSDNKGGLNRFDRKTNTFTRYQNDTKNPNSLLDNKVRAMFEDSEGNFWVGTGGNGLHKMDRETGKFTRYPFDSNLIGTLSLPPPNTAEAHITFILEDLEGLLWIGTYENGIIRWDPRTKTSMHYGTEGILQGDLTENSSWAAHVSTDGIIWLTTQQSNLYKIDPYIHTISDIPASGIITAVLEKGDTDFWIGTWANGLFWQNKLTGEKRQYLNKKDNPTSLSHNKVTALYADKADRLWVGTEEGLNRFNPESNSFIRYLHNANDTISLSDGFVSTIYEDSHSNLWIGTQHGLNKLDGETDTFTRYGYHPTDKDQLNLSNISAVTEDTSSNIWIGSLDDGIFKLDAETAKIEHVFQIVVIDLYTDKQGILWVAGMDGLWKSNEDWTDFAPFKSNESGIFVGEIVRSIIGDDDDNLWLGTSGGIIKLSADRENKEVYDKDNGIDAGEFHALSAVHKTKGGRIYFATSPNGYYTFQPNEFKDIPGTLKLYFTDLRVNNRSVTPRKDGPILTSLFDAEQVQLKYNENIFSMALAAIDFRSEVEKKMLYQLEGYDEEWQESLSGQKVNYNKVPPGYYTLKIKSPIRNSSEWKEKSIDILIAKPWWKTGWAYAIYLFLLLLGLFYFDKYQKQRILAKERALIKDKQLVQAKEIEKAYAELKATQSQLIQSEKMASLGELTAGIAHEIQNPLNFVNNFSEVNEELLAEMKEELDKGNIEDAKSIANDAIDNQQKINHHGKRADAIVKGMLQHSQSTSGIKEPTDINALADEYLRLAYHGLRAKDKSFNATMKTDFDKTIGKINIIPQDIGRVVLNLITNAFYACTERTKLDQTDYEPTVRVTTKKEGEKVVVSVKDNGNGIPKKVLDKIFQPFFTTKPTGQGTGLGLSLSYDIVKAHGGELKVETEVGKSTTFFITLTIK